MFRCLLIAFCCLSVLSCTEDQEEYLVETNDNLFPKIFFSNRYFTNNSNDFDSVQFKFDSEKRPVEKNIGWFGLIESAQKVIYTNDSEYKIIENDVVIETGTYQLKSYFKDKIIQKLTSVKGNKSTNYTYTKLEDDQVLDSLIIVEDSIVEVQKYHWKRNIKYPHLKNLDSIVSTNNTSDYKKTIHFTNYDTYQNPFIRLGIFEDINFRHLSFNNYLSAVEKVYDKNNKLISKVNLSTGKFYYKNAQVDLTK